MSTVGTFPVDINSGAWQGSTVYLKYYRANDYIQLSHKYYHNLYIIGHSLDITDRDILKTLIINDNVRTHIYYHNDLGGLKRGQWLDVKEENGTLYGKWNFEGDDRWYEIKDVEEEHVTMYESLIDPTETMFEKLLITFSIPSGDEIIFNISKSNKELYMKYCKYIQQLNSQREGIVEVELKIAELKAQLDELNEILYARMERLYEIGRLFINEGMDASHNPEFTTIEAYEAYTDLQGMRRLAEGMIRKAAQDVTGSQIVNYQGVEINFKDPFRWVSMNDLIKEKTDDIVIVNYKRTPKDIATIEARRPTIQNNLTISDSFQPNFSNV